MTVVGAGETTDGAGVIVVPAAGAGAGIIVVLGTAVQLLHVAVPHGSTGTRITTVRGT